MFIVDKFTLGNMTVGFDGLTYTLTLGRKRVVVSDDVKVSPRLKRIYRDRVSLNSKRSLLDALPQDVLVIVKFSRFYLNDFQAFILILYVSF